MSLYADVLRHAAERPERPAVEAPDGTLTYGELDCLAAAWASRLAAEGVAKGDRVCFALRKGCGAVALMQGILRLGAIYVPIDLSSPKARIRRILAHCAPRVLVVDSVAERISLVSGMTVKCLGIEDVKSGGPRLPLVHADGDDPAYVLYTSGSTGEPKGVCISHRNAEAFVDWVVETIEPVPRDRFANHAPFHFDLSVLDLYGAFRRGACVAIIPEEIAFAAGPLNRFLIESRVTIWYSVPSVLTLMLRDEAFPQARETALRAVFFAGEPFPIRPLRELFEAWGSAVRFFNLYGPTETNVCTSFEVKEIAPDRRNAVPIGAACSGDRVWAEHPGGRRAEVGEEGELMVAGPTVMLGYWGCDRLEGRPYATGDWVRRVDATNYEYAGRRDHQVKVRGYRMELGAIEAALEGHPKVARAVVVVEGEGLHAQLVAYVVPVNLGDEPGTVEIKRHCSQNLPPQMIVDRVRMLTALPLNGNGKVERRRLERPEALALHG